MYDLFFSNHAGWFAVPAIVGTAFFTLRLILMTIGIGDGGMDADVDAVDIDHGDTGEAFRVLSIQSIAAFVMGFGWGSLAAYRAGGYGMTASAFVGILVGAAACWLLGLLLKLLHDMQASGTVSIDSAVGLEGSVYATIPANRSGRGQVTVVIDQRQRTYNAVTEGEPLPTQTRVRVLKVNDDNTITVAAA